MKYLIIFSILTVVSIAVLSKDPFGPDPYGHNEGGEVMKECVLKDGKLYITFEKTTLYFFPEGVQNSRRLWKDVYCSSNGAIVLENKILANYIPPTSIPERVEWPTNN